MRAPEANRERPPTAQGSVAPAARAAEAPSLLASVTSLAWLESAAVIAASALATLYAEWRIVANPLTFQTDALIHEFWMRRFHDPELLDDPLTEALLATGYAPPGFVFLYRVASYVVDPVAFGELLPVVLVPLSVWFLFQIVRAHSAWRPAAWIASALFLFPWEIHRFSGGHPRAFAQPLVLLAVFLLVRRWYVAAAVVPVVGVLLYPPAGLVALALVLLAAVEPRPLRVDLRRTGWGALSAVGVAAVTLVPRFLTADPPELVTAAEARRYPEFGHHGQMEFFEPSILEYLRDNYSGFNLLSAGSILAVAAIFLLVVRPRNATLLRWEVWSLPIASLVLFAAAHALLFRLYLPHRYTYPLLPFFAIAIALALRPTLAAIAARARPLLLPAAAVLPLGVAVLALTVFPLGPRLGPSELASWLEDGWVYLAGGLAVGLVLAGVIAVTGKAPEHARPASTAAAAVLAGTVLVAHVAFAGGVRSPGASTCTKKALYEYLGTVPKDAIVAGDPRTLSCIPIAARRPVVISRKLYQPWEAGYFADIRERMFATVDAYYGSSVAAVTRLRTRYGADYVVVETPGRRRPPSGMAPFTGEIRRLLRSVDTPAVQRLPAECESWRTRKLRVYSLACVAESRR